MVLHGPPLKPAEKPDADPEGRLDVPPPALIHNWRSVFDRVRSYLRAVGIASEDADPAATRAIEEAASGDEWSASSNAFSRAFDRLRQDVADDAAEPTEPSAAFLRWRLARVVGDERTHVAAMPPLERVSMMPHHIEGHTFRRRLVSLRDARTRRAARAAKVRLRWRTTASWRRWVLILFVLIPTVIASQFMLEVLPNQGRTILEFAIVMIFGALFGWISIGFWTAIVGFVILLVRRDRFAISHELEHAPADIDPRARTAIIMPICEEPVERVFAGLRAMYASLEKTGQLHAFDFHVLSDSADVGTWVREEEAWLDWCKAVGGFGRIFYRRRRVRIERKSGNVADFCRRFGQRYRYMITLDADSLMTGDALVRLVRMIEERPEVGLIQTLPVPVHARSLYARIQQFANRVYGPMFATGTHFWQLGDAQYWGHNAIVRLAPFMKHCGLPRLPGRPPFGGEILSHDFVEAAMLGRAGFSVWLAYDLPGSYEELPSSLLEDLARDRRWCQGNFQHLRLVVVSSLFAVHRVLFVNGALAYTSAALWLLFLSLSTVEAILQVIQVPDYFPTGKMLFPQWPTWHPQWALSLFTVTMLILFLPKLLGAFLVLVRGQVRSFGGVVRFVLSLFFETIASSLYAPIRMLFHSKFVLTNLIGRVVQWKSPPRGDHETTWAEALRHHSGATILACAWGGGVYWLNTQYFWWLTPILGALVLSIPVSVLMSRMRLGDAARSAKLFATPEEIQPPPEVVDHKAGIRAAEEKTRALPPEERDGFVRAIVDPGMNALHRWLLRDPRPMRASIREARRKLCDRAIALGPSGLDTRTRRVLLSDAACVDELHARVWELERREHALVWGRPAARLPRGAGS